MLMTEVEKKNKTTIRNRLKSNLDRFVPECDFVWNVVRTYKMRAEHIRFDFDAHFSLDIIRVFFYGFFFF